MKVGAFLIEVKLVILNIERIWVLNCPIPLTCPWGLELLQGKGIQIQLLTPFKLAFTPMEIFPIVFFKVHKIETKGCAQSVFAAKTHIFLVQKTHVLFAWDQFFLPLSIKIFLKTHSGHNLLPLLYIAAGLHLQWAVVSGVLVPLESVELLLWMSTEAKTLPTN